MCTMGCSSSALSKAGDGSRFRSGGAGEQGPRNAPTLAGWVGVGLCVFAAPETQRVQPWVSLGSRGLGPSRRRRRRRRRAHRD